MVVPQWAGHNSLFEMCLLIHLIRSDWPRSGTKEKLESFPLG